MKHEQYDIGLYSRAIADFISERKINSRADVDNQAPVTKKFPRGSIEMVNDRGTPKIVYFLSGNGIPFQISFGMIKTKLTLNSVHEYVGYNQGKKDKDENTEQTRTFSSWHFSEFKGELERLSQEGGSGVGFD